MLLLSGTITDKKSYFLFAESTAQRPKAVLWYFSNLLFKNLPCINLRKEISTRSSVTQQSLCAQSLVAYPIFCLGFDSEDVDWWILYRFMKSEIYQGPSSFFFLVLTFFLVPRRSIGAASWWSTVWKRPRLKWVQQNKKKPVMILIEERNVTGFRAGRKCFRKRWNVFLQLYEEWGFVMGDSILGQLGMCGNFPCSTSMRRFAGYPLTTSYCEFSNS